MEFIVRIMIFQTLFKLGLYQKHLAQQPNADSWVSTHQLPGAGPGACICMHTPWVSLTPAHF